MTPELADSTLGMAAYNALAVCPQPLTGSDVFTMAVRMMQHELDQEQMQRALDKLVALKYIYAPNADAKYALIASESLVVVVRDRTDYDPKTRDGGWHGWRVKDPRIRDGQGTRPLEQLIGLPPAKLSRPRTEISNGD